MISPQLVKELRDKTGAGMADCKRALDESNGDLTEAIDWLRKRGAASIAKRADRDANEGIVIARGNAEGTAAAIVEINCETDFVARNDEFVAFANAVADAVLANNFTTEEEIWAVNIGGKTLGNYKDEILAKFSEKIELRRFDRIETTGFIADYVHAGSRLAVLVEFAGTSPGEEGKGITRDVAMQIAAMQPMFVDRSQVNQEVLDKELEIYKQAALEEGKKEDIAERIAQGKLTKFYEEQVLVEQTFVKDSSRKVADVVSQLGSDVKVVSFRRYNLGEKV